MKLKPNYYLVLDTHHSNKQANEIWILESRTKKLVRL